jgi:hypothetical protein
MAVQIAHDHAQQMQVGCLHHLTLIYQWLKPLLSCTVQCCAADGLSLAADEAEGFFRVAQYGQVYTLQTRLNEMMLKVQL